MDQPPVTTPAVETGRPGPASDTSRLLAALGYPLWPVALIALLIDPYKDEKFVKFHAIQALGLGLAIWVVSFVLTFAFGIGALIGLLGLIYQIILALQANKGQYFEVPVVYGIVKGYMGE
jgi:uncharacterized membrane protein